MRPQRLLLAALTAWIVAGPAQAAPATVLSDRPEQVSLTVYQDWQAENLDIDDPENRPTFDGGAGLALVSEWRTIDVPAGETRINFRGVAEGIVPQTATLDGLPSRLVESNQDYDLLSPASLIRQAVGQKVQRITTNPITGKETVEDAVIRSGPKGVVLEVGGRFEAIGCGGQPQRLVFPRAPAGLSDRPTLSLLVRVEKAGRYRVRLSYLATGVLWRARYVMTLSPDGERLDLAGWITLINTSDTSFAEAPTQVVAGRVARSDATAATVIDAETVEPRCWPMDTTTKGRRLVIQPRPPLMARPVMDGDVEAVVVTGSRIRRTEYTSPMAVTAIQSELGDYKLYSLASPTTLAARQTKQVMMLSREAIKTRWAYAISAYPDDDFDADDDPRFATTVVKAVNTKANGLGVPLPGGRVSFMQSGDDGRALLVGEGALWTAPVGAPLEVSVGEDPEVEVRGVTLSREDKGDLTVRRNRIVVRNLKAQAVVFEYRLGGSGDQAFKVTRQSSRSKRTPDGMVWTLRIPPGGQASLTYTVESEY